MPVAIFGATKVDPCSNGAPLPVYVDIGGCIEQPCDMVRGKTGISQMQLNIGMKKKISSHFNKTEVQF